LSDEWLELLLYGGQDYEENFHKCGFTRNTLVGLLLDENLEIIHEEQTDAGNIEVWAVK
jgi:hypothetical protein